MSVRWEVNAKMPNSPSLAYQSRYMDDEGQARSLLAKKLKAMGKKGHDVWLVRWDRNPDQRSFTSTVVEGPGWRDLYNANPQNP